MNLNAVVGRFHATEMNMYFDFYGCMISVYIISIYNCLFFLVFFQEVEEEERDSLRVWGQPQRPPTVSAPNSAAPASNPLPTRKPNTETSQTSVRRAGAIIARHVTSPWRPRRSLYNTWTRKNIKRTIRLGGTLKAWTSEHRLPWLPIINNWTSFLVPSFSKCASLN